MHNLSILRFTNIMSKRHIVWTAGLASLLVLAIGFRFVLPVHAETNSPVRANLTAQPLHGGFADLIEEISPAVVSVHVSSTVTDRFQPLLNDRPGFPQFEFWHDMPGPWQNFPDWMKPDDRQNWRGEDRRRFRKDLRRKVMMGGSGIVIDAEGYIVTNAHVIHDADQISITLSDGSQHDANVVGVDERSDLAVLSIDAGESLPYAEFGDSDAARVGDWVVAVGDGLGFSRSASLGIVSGVDRVMPAAGRNFVPTVPLLQFDATINRGNSGGPLFNAQGEIIGINTLIFSPSGFNVGLGFAIPSNIVRDVTSSLVEYGRVNYGFLGVMIQPVDKNLAEAFALPESKPTGALIAGVDQNTPAANANLQVGEVVLEYDGKIVKSVNDFVNKVQATRPGTEVQLKTWFEGKPRTVQVHIGTKDGAEMTASREQNSANLPDIGLSITEIDEQVRSSYQLDENVKGLMIDDVMPGGMADRAGLQPGDIINKIDHQSYTDAATALNYLADQQKDNKNVLIYVNRAGVNQFLVFDLS